MSGSEDQGGAGRREVAYRLFAAEFEDADFSYSESDEERAPNYVVTPTGGRVNRLFVVGVLTEVENASDDVLRARVVDPTGAFVVYAGQYQPDAQAFFERAQPPMFVAVTGKARTFQPDDSDVTYTSIRPENVNEVDAETRDRWTVGTARQTLDRVRTMAHALQMDERGDELRAALESQGIDTGLASGIPLAIDHYGTTPAYLAAVRDTAVQALEVVTGDREEVDGHSASPDAPGEADLASLAAMDIAPNVGGESTDLGGALDKSSAATASETSTAETTETTTAETTQTSTADETASGTESESSATAETADADTGADVSAESSETTTEVAAESNSESTEPESAADDSEPTTTDSEPVEATTSETGGTAVAESTETAVDEPAETDAAVESTADEPAGTADAGGAGDDLDDFDPGEFELDEEEREEIESEYGTEFQSGSEVGEPGEAGIETPDPDELAEGEPAADATADDTGTVDTESEPEPETESEPEPAEESTDSGPAEESAEVEPADQATEPAEDVDVEDAVMDAMADLDDGDGASADDIVDAVTSRTGASGDAVRDAIQDALMDGRCYEPDDDVYKPI
ncbi:RPA family protein [Halosimplex sp. J119]